MSFTFDFPAPDDSDSDDQVLAIEKDQNNTKNGDECQSSQSYDRHCSDSKQWFSSQEIDSFFDKGVVNNLSTTSIEFNDVLLKIIDTSSLEQSIMNDSTLKSTLGKTDVYSAISSHSDLVSASYEGGLKVWECGVDLANFLATHSLGKNIELKDSNVLEVGCGVGLPGLYCIRNGARSVHFQDYNEEVLKLVTFNNVCFNTEDMETSPESKFFSGDWDSFTNLALKNDFKYDIILSAETIYNEENYAKLHRLFDSLLADRGKVILAAKAYYFGVGGNVEAFCEFVHSKNVFMTEEVHSIEKGVPRKILCLQKKMPS